jgi:hypothetical protein
MKPLTWLTLMLLPFSLNAEISKVTVKWLNPIICQEGCVNEMTKQFGTMNGAAEVIINQGGGQVDIRWKPRTIFSFAPLNTAMRLVGPSINAVNVSVRGTVSHSGNTFTLDSLGDNTKFILLGPVNPNMKQYTVVHNTDNRPLPDDVKTKLLEAEKNFEIVQIDGPLLDPWRYQVLYLVVEKLEAISLGSQH